MSEPRTAIITGAGSGIGRALCTLLAGDGFAFALVGRTESKLEETVHLLAAEAAHQTPTLIIPADVSDAQQARGAVDLVLEQWGRIDVLVNNAAVAPMVRLDEADEDVTYRIFAANVFGPLQMIAQGWPVFVRQRQGTVVNVSSVSAVDPSRGLGVYGASKAALEGLTRAIMAEGREHGLRAFSVAPGAVETPMLRGLFSDRELPREHTLDPMDVARVIAQCIRGEREGDIGRTILVPSP